MIEGCHSLRSGTGTIVELISLPLFYFFTLLKTEMIHNATFHSQQAYYEI